MKYMNIKDYLKETDPRHTHMIDSVMYMFAVHEAEVRNCYLLLYVKKKPWWMPEFVYRFILKRVLILNEFKKHSLR